MRVNHANGQLTYQIDVDKQAKTGFDYSCDFMTTGKLGALIPTQAIRVTYGDRVKNTSSMGVQFEPLAVPMMANMFLKQEHYYVPYNCVWQNYDQWRSGGEGLMYGEEFLTPAPSINISTIMDINFWLNNLAVHYLQVANGAAKVLYLNKQVMLQNINQQKSLFLNYATQLGIEDIANTYFISVFDEIIDLFNNYDFSSQPGYIDGVTNINLIPFFREKYVEGDGEYNNQRLPNGYELAGDWKMLYNNITSIFKRWQFNIDAPLYPTEFGIKFIETIYKQVKPICGIGSNLDCLNINRVLPVDFYYNFLYSIFQVIDEKENSNAFDAVETPYYLNIGVDMFSDVPFNVFNLRALYLIWYNNYRDQLLETNAPKPITLDSVSEIELITLLVPRHRCWEKDTFTTALNNPATADAVVPLNAQAVKTRSQEIIGVGKDEIQRNDKDIYEIVFKDGEKFRLPTNFLTGYSPLDSTLSDEKGYFSISLLDSARRAQKFFRKALYYGNRIQDFIYVNWGVNHLDARLRLPELLATSSNVAEMQSLVNNTTTAESVAGDRAGYSFGTDKGSSFDRFCEEDGVIMSLMTIMPQPTYGYGTDRQYACLDRYDMPLPDFATDGMDAVYDNELMALPTKVWNKERMFLSDMPNVFGYQGRYYSEKWRPSTEHGELLTTQDMYTFGRRFNPYDADGRPVLNYEFVHCFPTLDMFVMQDGREDVFRASVYHDTMTDRTLPYHSIYF